MKKIKLLVMAMVLAMVMIGCNKQMIDLNQSFDYAIIALPNGEIVEGEIKSWKDYDDGEQLQITFKNGDVYLTNSFRCDLIRRGE